MNKWSRLPHDVEEGCGHGCDSSWRILNIFFAHDLEANRPGGRSCRPGTECLCEA
jgi:hypothetical protein